MPSMRELGLTIEKTYVYCFMMRLIPSNVSRKVGSLHLRLYCYNISHPRNNSTQACRQVLGDKVYHGWLLVYEYRLYHITVL
jgi:hypothetical protein